MPSAPPCYLPSVPAPPCLPSGQVLPGRRLLRCSRPPPLHDKAAWENLLCVLVVPDCQLICHLSYGSNDPDLCSLPIYHQACRYMIDLNALAEDAREDREGGLASIV